MAEFQDPAFMHDPAIQLHGLDSRISRFVDDTLTGVIPDNNSSGKKAILNLGTPRQVFLGVACWLY